MKLKNEMKQNKRSKTYQKFQINVQNTSRLMSYLAFCFRRLKAYTKFEFQKFRTSRS